MIVEFRARKPRKVRGTTIAEGQSLYAVRKGDLYFVWSYSHRASAQYIDNKVSGPTDASDRAANWRKSVHATTPSDIQL